MDLLLDILSYRREHNSKGELAFINKYMKGFKTLKDNNGEILAFYFDNRVKDQRTMFVSHIDSVHHSQPDRTTQMINHDKEFDIIYCDKNEDCLGADDGTGVALMLEMIKADKKGFYLFTRGEEKGCIGSKGLIKHHADLLNEFDHAIQFDRKGVDSIITHQMNFRSCSDRFGSKLAEVLNHSNKFKLDPNGVYTDTAEMVFNISECTNVSVGYFNQHTNNEYQDYAFYKSLRDHILSIEWHEIKFPAERPKDSMENYYAEGFDDLRTMSYRDIKEWAKVSTPEEIANSIEELLFDLEYNSRAIYDY